MRNRACRAPVMPAPDDVDAVAPSNRDLGSIMRVFVSVAIAAASLALCASEAGAVPARGAHARARVGAHGVHRLRTTRVLHHYSALARANGAGRVQRISTGAADGESAGRSDDVGFIKDADHAGYGMRKDNTEAVLGAYRRPADPNLPATDMFHEGKGAAGVSWSVKLGGH